MLTVLESEEQIAKAQTQFKSALAAEMTREIGVVMGLQGGELAHLSKQQVGRPQRK